VGRNRIGNSDELLELIGVFGRDYGKRYGEGSQSPEAGIRINTVRVASYVTTPKLRFADILPPEDSLHEAPEAEAVRPCHFVGVEGPIETAFHTLETLALGAVVTGPAVVISQSTTFLVEPGWRLSVGRYGAGWLQRNEPGSGGAL
jgi:N-methylhydantoinase A